eukprot:3701836-Amphidinium_carterae.1
MLQLEPRSEKVCSHLGGFASGPSLGERLASVLLTGTRTRRIPFPASFDLRRADQVVPGEFSKILA